jgi:4-hydroxy-3-methylbut-2-enyl diphosphate reductase IspH
MDTVGITAGTSTPDVVIDGVENELRSMAQNSPAHLPAVTRRAA